MNNDLIERYKKEQNEKRKLCYICNSKKPNINIQMFLDENENETYILFDEFVCNNCNKKINKYIGNLKNE
jgi:hypothetical protein